MLVCLLFFISLNSKDIPFFISFFKLVLFILTSDVFKTSLDLHVEAVC